VRAMPGFRPVVAFVLLVLLVAPLACGSPAAPTPAPTAPPAAQPTNTAAPAPTTPPTAVPTPPPATPTVEAKPTAVPAAAAPSPTSASSGFDSLKPATPTAAGQGQAGLPPVVDRLKPIEALTPTVPPAGGTPTAAAKSGTPSPAPKAGTPTPAAKGATQTPVPKPDTTGQPKPITKLQVQPTPTVSRKGVANPKVDPQQYLMEMAGDLQKLADAVSEAGETVNAYEEGDASEDEVVANFTKAQTTVRDLYVREVQRDYPPQLKEIDDYYVESMRSATGLMDALVMALQTGDMKYLDEASQHADKFQYFLNELVKRLGS